MGRLPHSMLFSKGVLAALVLYCLYLFAPNPALAGNWRVSPIKIYFDPQQRSEVINIINEGEQNLSLEVSAAEWSQDQEGKDVYQAATDLIFFPKALTIEPDQERLIRTGIKVPVASREKTYRLFIKETAGQSQSSSTAVAIAIQFAIPVFIKPPKEDLKGTIADISVRKGNFSATILNDGNIHFRINTLTLQGITATGESVYTQELPGWYVLSGAQRPFTTTIPAEICQQIKTLKINVHTNSIKLNGEIDVDKVMCTSP